MNIKVGDYQITSDSYQFIVNKIGVVQESRLTKAENVGKETLKPIAYCCKFEEALKFIPQDILRTNDDISEVRRQLDEIHDAILFIDTKPVIVVKEEPKVKIVSDEEMEDLENE